MRRAHLLLFLLVALLLVPTPALPAGAAPAAPAHAAAGSPITITPTNPLPGSLTNNPTPTISATFTDSSGTIQPASVDIKLDGTDITGFQGYTVTSGGFSEPIPSYLALANGNHTVVVSVTDNHGVVASDSWGFTVNTSAVLPTSSGPGINPLRVLEYVGIGAGIFAAAFGAYILYLKRTRKFTFRKYFATHPVNRGYLTIILPSVAAFLFVLVTLGVIYQASTAPPLTAEYVITVALFLALTPYALDSRADIRRLRASERAFAQFLFEMADAMRGGLDPAKALIELSQTDSGILRKGLRIAADGIRLGRPFDQVLRNLAKPMRSRLITRYAELIADSSSVGGETAVVVHRAAKDMDDFLKIEQERSAALTMPIAVIYIAFGVLLAVLFSLLSVAPDLGSLNIPFLTSAPTSASGAASHVASTVPQLTVAVLRERFMDLMMINALGSGVIVGAFTEGKPKYGLLHSLVLLAVTAVAFFLFA